jgi:probable F420-dependent oxidoreductase
MSAPGAPARSLRVGIFLPFGELMLDGATPRWADLLALARLAEDVGFDSLWLGDHMLMPFPDHPSGATGAWDCWSLLAALAAVTRRVELGPLVSCSGYRNPALLAKMADTVDEISGGRLVLGLGAGWAEREYRAFGYPFDHRASRFEEAIRIIRGLLRDGHVDVAGRFYQARDCALRPRGPRPQGPPILVGTDRPRMLGATARHADQWNAEWKSVAQVAALRGAVDVACAEVGRDPATLARTAAVPIAVPGLARRSPVRFRNELAGTPEELAAQLRAYADLGITHIQALLFPNTPAAIAAFAPVLALLDGGAGG